MIHIKYCKRCGKAFDIDTSKDFCPKCRLKINPVLNIKDRNLEDFRK